MLGPECATRAASVRPGGGSPQSLNVRILTLRRTALNYQAHYMEILSASRRLVA